MGNLTQRGRGVMGVYMNLKNIRHKKKFARVEHKRSPSNGAECYSLAI